MNNFQVSPPKISVVVPCYQHAQELSGCLSALANQRTQSSFEIIVVDSANDPDVQAVCDHYPDVMVYSSQERLFCGAAKNQGALKANSEYLAFTDSDCRPEPEWIDQAVEIIESGKLLAGGPVLDALPSHLIAISDNALQFSDMQPERPAGKIRHVPGCNMVIKKDVFFEIGGLPNLNSGDDVTLTDNFKDQFGDQIYFSPELRVKHLGRFSISGLFSHNHSFGKIRAKLGLHLSKKQQEIGRYWWFIPAVVTRRYLYIQNQTLKYNLVRFFRNILLTPLLLIGLMAYAIGFWEGCQIAFKMKDPNHE